MCQGGVAVDKKDEKKNRPLAFTYNKEVLMCSAQENAKQKRCLCCAARVCSWGFVPEEYVRQLRVFIEILPANIRNLVCRKHNGPRKRKKTRVFSCYRERTERNMKQFQEIGFKFTTFYANNL